MTPDRLHQIAVECGACVMGDGPHHYLLSAEQLAALVSKVRTEPTPVPPPVAWSGKIPPPPC